VLLAIRDVNIGPLRQAADRLPAGLLALCEKGLARDPDARFETPTRWLARSSPSSSPPRKSCKRRLRSGSAGRVTRASSPAKSRARCATRCSACAPCAHASSGGIPAVDAEAVARTTESVVSSSLSSVRRADGQTLLGIPFAKLIEMNRHGRSRR